MAMRKRIRQIVLLITLVFFGFVVASSLGVFSTLPYTEVPHGNHTHYVPKDRDPNVPIDRFPTQRPRENERITPDGRIVPMDAEN
jgi:hypothetical protein